MGNAQSSGDNEVYPTIVPKKKPSTPYNFFDMQHTADLPSPTRLRKESTHTSSARSHTSNSNKSVKDTANYFEMAAVTHEPSLPSKASSPRGTTPASSIKKSYTQSSSQLYQLTPTSSRSSSSKTINTQTEKKKPPSNVSDHLMIDGRIYSKSHASKNFMLPCDDDEADRLMTMVNDILCRKKKDNVAYCLFSIISLKPCFNGILYHLFMSHFHLVRN